MATVQGTGSWIQKSVHLEVWSGFAASGDVGTSLNAPGLPDKSVSVDGTFTGGLTIIIEGGNDGTNFDQMHDVNGNLLSFAAAGVKAIAENFPYTRARATAGSGGAVAKVQIASTRSS